MQLESSDLEVMYNEMAELLNKLDDQIHDLHRYYTLRPHCGSPACCDKVSHTTSDITPGARASITTVHTVIDELSIFSAEPVREGHLDIPV